MSIDQKQNLQTLILSLASVVVIGLGGWQLKTVNDLSGQVIRLTSELDATKNSTSNRYTSLDAAKDWSRQAEIDSKMVAEQTKLAGMIEDLQRRVASLEFELKVRK